MCLSIILAPPSRQLEVTFLDVDLPSLNPVTGECNADYLEVGGTKFCGTFQNRVGKWRLEKDLASSLPHITTRGRQLKGVYLPLKRSHRVFLFMFQ